MWSVESAQVSTGPGPVDTDNDGPWWLNLILISEALKYQLDQGEVLESMGGQQKK